jgi:hypothetical protein
MATIDIAGVQSRGLVCQNPSNGTASTYQIVANGGVGTAKGQSTGPYFNITFSNNLPGTYDISSYEVAISFDFSSIPAGTINSASIFLTATGYGNGGNYDGPSPVYFIPYDWGANISNASYIAGSAVNSITKYSTMTLTRAPDKTVYSSSATPSFLTAIANRSLTKLAAVLKTTVDVGTSNITPIQEDEIIYSVENSSASLRPKITVDYTPDPVYNLIVAPMPTYSQIILQSSPILYWRMNTTSGTTVTDYSGSARNGTISGTPTLNTAGLVTGDSDTAITFNNNYASRAYATWMDVSNITLEAIVKPAILTGGTVYSILDRDSSGAAPRVFQFRINATAKFETIFWDTTGALWTTTGSTTLVAGNTYHLAATHNGSVTYLYVNGILDGTLAHSGSMQTGNRQFNVASNAAAFQFFNGVIDEVAWYGTALSAGTILYHSQSSGR